MTVQLFRREMARGKKLFLCRVVLVCRLLYRLPEGSRSKSLCPGCEGSVMIFPARFLVLERYRSWMEGRGAPMILSAARTVRCSLHLSCLVAAPYQTVMEEHRTDSMTAV